MIVQGRIEPIEASKLHLKNLQVPVPAPDGVFVPGLVSQEPIRVTEETIEHARKCAERIISVMDQLPHTAEAGDALAMAYVILHFAGKGRE